MNKKGKIIITCVIAGVIICLFICVFVVMSVKSTKINFLFKTEMSESSVVEQLNSAGVIPYGKSTFFVNKQEIIDKAEQVCPKLKVHNVEFVFPDVVKINCSERIDLLCFTDKTGKSYVLDSELKVLSVANAEQISHLTKLTFNEKNIEDSSAYDEEDFDVEAQVAQKINFAYLNSCSKLFTYITQLFGEGISLFNEYFEKIDINQGTINGTSQKIEKVVFHLKTGNKKVEFENVTDNMIQRVEKLKKISAGEEIIAEDYIILT